MGKRVLRMLVHHYPPYRVAFVAAVLIIAALFVLSPPFEWKPYQIEEAKAFEVIAPVEDVVIPPPPPPVPLPPMVIDPEPGDPHEFPETTAPEGIFPPPPPPPGPPGNGPFFAIDRLPEPVHLERPRYPELAREAGIEGSVALKVYIGTDGRVHDAKILSSDVTAAMEQAALKAAFECRYRPAKQRDTAVAVWVVIRYAFTLGSP